MNRPRTIFGPFALVAVLSLGVALWQIERTVAPTQVAAMPAPERAELTRKGGRAALVEPPRRTPQQMLRARLVIPVEGVVRRELSDTWGDARSEGRSHQGIDIMAAQGTRVHAVADGRIVKFFESERGGITIYQFDSSERFVYYYAHLSARAASLLEDDYVRQGQVIGYVGSTGNASTPHLHFEIGRLDETRRWWVAEAMNPYPLLMTGEPPR
jgi:murein DD-endopeptidase MepM/ murein hydrolase activator NlpD